MPALAKNICVLFTLLAAASAFSAENMIGRQSQNEGIFAVPASGPVTIDGDLADWDLSGQVWSFADTLVRDRFSVKTAAMWDRDNLYLAFLWKDPTPMFSTINPDFDPDKGWISDAIQLRVCAGGQTSWMDTWYHTPTRRAVFQYSYWKDETSDTKGLDQRLLIGKPDATDLGGGIQLAYKKLPAGDGFIQEMRIPWSVVYRKAHAAAAGDVFKMGMEFLWGPATGDTWPIHRYADNMAQGETSREFFWTGRRLWGEVRLLAEGKIAPRRYIPDSDRLTGCIPVRATLPGGNENLEKIAGFTLVVEDADGRRVRNLAGDLDPQEYAVKDAPAGTVEVPWDGLDDSGKLVPPGEYKIRGLAHGPLGADFQRTYYNPGTPPWATADGSGAWGADHSPPQFAARCGDWMILAWGFAEGGSGILGVAPEGRKRWGEKRGVSALAANTKHLFAVPNSWHTTEEALLRMEGTTGQFAPFIRNGAARPVELPVQEILADTPIQDKETRGRIIAMAATNVELAILFSGGYMALIEADSGELIRTMHLQEALFHKAAKDSPFPGLAFSPDGKKLAISTGGKLAIFMPSDGSVHTPTFETLATAGPVTYDPAGTLWVMDTGPDQQIKAYDADGKLLGTAARKGGRPIRGTFLPDAVKNVSSLATDARGDVWAVECWEFPRRVSVWSPQDGTLVRDYIGNTGYAGAGGFLHEQDPARGYLGPMEFLFDPDSRGWKLNAILWCPDREKGESFAVNPGDLPDQSVFYSDASGTRHEYMFAPLGGNYRPGYVIFMRESGDDWRPVTMIGTVGGVSGTYAHHGNVETPPAGDFAEYNLYDGMFWNDRNRDGKVQFDECEIIKTAQPGTPERGGRPGIPLQDSWGTRMDTTNLTLYTVDREEKTVCEYRPTGFTPEGAPIYGPASMRNVGFTVSGGEAIPVEGQDTAISLSWDNDGRLAGFSRSTGRELWTYPTPYHFVHGSHRATMPKPGLLIGTLQIMGIVDGSQPEKAFFGMRGNLGQDFYMTTDGLYITAMCLDGRLPGMSLPATEDEMAAMPIEMFSNGGEPFNGWLGRQSDGVIRMTNGMAREAVMVTRLRGFETMQRFAAPQLALTPEMCRKAEAEDVARKQEAAKKLEYAIKRKPADGWDEIPEIQVRKAGQPAWTRVRLAYDDDRLYARFEVHNDPSPWKNTGNDVSRLFKTGDCVDIQLSPTANEADNAADGDLRILVAKFGDNPVAVLMREVDTAADGSEKVSYKSPVMTREMARVKVLDDADLRVHTGGDNWSVELSIPWAALGMKPEKGKTLRGDVGFILSNDVGTENVARVYWSNQDTNLVNDLPSEAILQPARWATMRFE